jgi:hypothetical protein
MAEQTTKLFAIHDLRGDITGIVTGPGEGPQPATTLDVGLTLTEVNGPELAAAVNDQDKQRVDELIGNFKVENGALTRKNYSQ